MAQVVVLSDTILWGELGNSRYMGAYAVANSARQAGYHTVVIDYFTRHPDFFDYLEQFLEKDTLCIGISSTFLAPFLSVHQKKKQRSEGLNQYYKGDLWFAEAQEFSLWFEKLKQLVRRKSPHCKLILGGVKSQFALWRPEAYSIFDYVILGPADQTFPLVIRSLQNSEIPVHQEIRGTKVIDNQVDLLKKTCPVMQWQPSDAVQAHESLPLEVARGCVFNCKFCHYDKKESSRKDLSLLRNEFIRNYELFGTTTYHFCDDCFNDHPKKVHSICEMILSLPFQVEWTSYARVDVAVKFPETLDLMVASGARGLYWGLESFNGDVARNAGKGTPPDKVQEFLKSAYAKHHENCLFEGSFITGLPGETDESLTETLKWLCDNPVLDFTTIGVLGLMPYVQSLDKQVFDYAEYSRNPEKHGFTKIQFKPNYWEHATMNSDQATIWAEKMTAELHQIRPPGFMRTIWQYPHFKSLGFSKEEIFHWARSSSNWQERVGLVGQRFESFLQNYWIRLQSAELIEQRKRSQGDVRELSLNHC